MVASKYYFTFLKQTLLKFVKTNKNVPREKLLEFGAMKLAAKVALEEQLREDETEKLCADASTNLAFNVGGSAHKLSHDNRGLTYDLTRNGKASIPEKILYKEFEDFSKLPEEEKQKVIGKILAQHRHHEEIWISQIGPQTLPKKAEKMPESETTLFNMLIDGLIDKIPPATTTADSITDNLWWSLASEVAHSLVLNNKNLVDVQIGKDRDGLKFVHILAEGEHILYQFEFHNNGIFYKSGEKEKLFKEYKEIVSDFMKKTNLE